MPYKWYCAPNPDGACEVIRCSPASPTTQFITRDFLLEAEVSPFHDRELARATRQINQIFARLEERNADNGRELAVLLTPLGHVLAWTVPEPDPAAAARVRAVDAESSESEIRQALRLKTK